ncbi:MAG: hypothetical protein AAGA37_02860 [Actinomycetota bacterium]
MFRRAAVVNTKLAWSLMAVVLVGAGCSAGGSDSYVAPTPGAATADPLVFDGGPVGDETANGYRCELAVFAEDLEWRHILCDFNGLQGDFLDTFGDAISDDQANRAGTAQLTYAEDRTAAVATMLAVNEALFEEIRAAN